VVCLSSVAHTKRGAVSSDWAQCKQDHAYIVSGTTEVFGVHGNDAMHAEGLLSAEWQGLNQFDGPRKNGADTIA
jgi:hypothetical protein